MKLQTHFSTGQRKKYALALFLCLIFSLAAVSPAAAADLPEALIPLGMTAGIRSAAEGVAVAGLLEVQTDDGVRQPAGEAGLAEGDRILSINGTTVNDTASMRALIAESGISPLTLTVRRGDKELDFSLTPVKASDGNLRIGVWIRDAMLGIGTLTFYDPRTGRFGALGHGVTGSDDKLMDIDGSVLVPSSVREVVRGQCGTPGELRGSFDESRVIGDIEKNTGAGIFGSFTASPQAEPIPLCPSGDIKEGTAQILSCVEGDAPQLYDIRILRLYGSDHGNLRNMLIEVTDEALLARTGGIVQGMSGSPICQNGKIVGAVTHVLVNDPTRGYGIFIENML
ncbi:MAG: SpoIVB peptidase, partial [Ruminococcaceae bacterium]|nr:SpoIVB peptidase [Oscillospiraceae bacterium]